MRKAIFTIGYILVALFTMQAQMEYGTVRPIQISVLTPLGTNGIESPEIANTLSLNFIAGYNGGVEGFELGVFCNFIKHDVNGVQLAGFSNAVGNNMRGFQGASYVNVTRGHAEGAQVSGLVNAIVDSARAIQGTGIINFVGGNITGVQGAGIVNVALKEMEGVQGAGIVNFSGSDVTGVQGAGIANATLGSAEGVQGAGIVNVALGSVKGAQVSGILNVAIDTLEGFQGSGCVNATRVLKGYQLGIVNICDTIEEGMPIGLFSVVRRGGLREIEVWGGYNLYAGITGKIGTEKLYSIFTIGTKLPEDNELLWATGFGLGTQTTWKNNMIFGFEGVGYNYFNSNEMAQSNWSGQLRFSFAKPLTKHLAVFVAPNFNISISDNLIPDTDRIAKRISPYDIYNSDVRDYNVRMWAGFQAGVRVLNL